MRAAVFLILTACVTCGASPLGLEAWLNPGLLAFPPDAQIKLIATTAGEGATKDYKLLQPGQTATILTIEGPAVIHRIWSTSEHVDKTRLILKLDGSERKLWEDGKLPEGQPPDDPLRAMDGKAYWSYLPIKVSAKAEFIATDQREATGEKKPGEETGSKFYLQVAYSEGESGASEEIVQEARKRLKLLTDNPLAGISDIVEHGPEHAPAMQMITLSPETPVKLPASENEVIEAMVIDAGQASFEQLKGTRLMLKSDGAAEACVDVPIPYLFGAYWGLADYSAPLTAIIGQKLIFRFPIPIGNGLEFGLQKLGAGQTARSLQITLQKTTLKDAPPYRFCAEYHAMISKKDEPLHFADIKGEGVFVGCTMAADGLEHRKFAFLEGNDQITVDGAPKPTWEGTGTEDFFNSAWYFSSGATRRAFHGLTRLITGPPPQMSAYRYLIPDRIGFKQSLKFDMQHGSRNSAPDTYYQCVALWYQKPPCKVAVAAEVAVPKVKITAPGEAANEEHKPAKIDPVTPTILALVVLLAFVAGVKYLVRRRR